jgi:hypothetical protein
MTAGFIPKHGGYQDLLEDYRDYLRTHNAPLWSKDSKEALFVRKLGRREDESYETYRTYIDTRPARTAVPMRSAQ